MLSAFGKPGTVSAGMDWEKPASAVTEQKKKSKNLFIFRHLGMNEVSGAAESSNTEMPTK
jgi:hypothetical protein